ncbi:MAG: hypothetical protein J0H83_04330 [Candidatus Melainabacteria bacterium]|nr:hypothetical protein [Candidatus Melainabacteria bacterium]MBX9673106.1 hypothetical protein [Candidatus Obscuribacterales bacterium]
MKISSALVAASLFLAINFALPASTTMGRKADAPPPNQDLIQRSLASAKDQLDQAFAKQTEASAKPIVMIGSSLIIAPLWSADVKNGHCHVDSLQHHRSIHLETLLHKQNDARPAISLATAGQFVSDTYLITEKYLKGPTKPDVLIYGIAPRDFMDDTTGGLALTSVFDGLVTLEDYPRIAPLFFTSFNEKADFVLNRTVFLYRKRGRYQVKVNEAIEKASQKVVARLVHTAGKAGESVVASSDSQAPGGFLLGGDRKDIWAKSVEEYARRYKHYNLEQFQKQKQCLAALIDLCKERDIKLYVVAMPLTRDNTALMPAGFFKDYLAALDETTRSKNVPLIDLVRNGKYVDDDFYDTVHLTFSGGEKFLTMVADLVKPADAEAKKQIAGTKKLDL